MKLNPTQVKDKFGPMFSQRFLTMVDASKGVAEIVETCAVKGTIEWDAVNRCRAGGAIQYCEVEGTTMVMRARLGESPIKFGPTDVEYGGQGLESVALDGDKVHTRWAGCGGAGLGVAACLAQAPGVLYSIYPTEEDLKVGGARANRVELVTPLYEKVTIGIDDTDNKEGGATWVLALKASKLAAAIEGVQPLNLRLIQLFPKSPHKTTNCVSSAITFAARPGAVDKLVDNVVSTVKQETRSNKTGIAVYRGIGISPALNSFGWEVKKRLVSVETVEENVKGTGIEFVDLFPDREGRIGALAAIALSEERTDAAALYNDTALPLIKR
ncbi:MAG TPA: tRNA(Ile2) 2-agmatinylcytidine synthetase [Methanocella sp.]|uniref:tRNA(Ile2) 2-agmatinylcytidine synthetase n=1 Tax=Methanocella sp. TaxID=2052833 RepID=UPI002BD560FC|nr:tRNA(Ile2) 2-agmatinylcytidine synthetase [Methanocella sp.]HTY91825.1 tRNA(Ile2) 2-agmatinylcytidine synthetase [Methanocella sp.]